LSYNKLRQAKVTTELCEIISGANSVWRKIQRFYIIY
jgi:F0F1-type ATP synthase gamma subunit